jgi:succinate dehydrogenase / fumarate reductase cytochrome b subunit
VDKSPPASSWWARNDFLIRRLHSLSGLIPVGAYMVVHLLTNASINNSVLSFVNSVYTIHSLGKLLPVVEWVFIFLPILFHAILGVVIIREGLPNHNSYRYTNNFRYSLQRATGMIAFVFIVWHVFHMHGWFHFAAWQEVTNALNGANFRPYNAASTAAEAFQGPGAIVVNILYTIIWTMGITWGLWVTPASQRWANYLSVGFGVFLAAVALSAQFGFATLDAEEARKIEDQTYKARVEAGLVEPNEHKRRHDDQNQAQTTDETKDAAATTE